MSAASHMINTMKIVRKALQKTISDLFGTIEGEIPLLPYQKGNEFDYQSAIANKLFAQLKKKNPQITQQYSSPSALAENIRESIVGKHKHLIDHSIISPQGFILFRLSKDIVKENIKYLIENPVKLEQVEKKTVLVDFSSPNIAKEMHVGHLRSTIIGESICRFLEFQGHLVHRVNHLGDWGTQFGMLISHLSDKYPNFIEQTPELKDLETFYKESKKRFDSDADFKKRAQQAVVQLQGGDEFCRRAWKVLCDISQQFYDKVYKRLDIKLDSVGESFYNDMLKGLIEELTNQGFIKEDQGAKCLFVPGKKMPLMVVKSDGAYNYDSTDLAALHYRVRELSCDRIIYITDVGQYPHFELVFAGGKHIGWVDPKKVRLDHMGFGIVLGEDGCRMKTRGGETIKLLSLLDEGKDRAKKQLIERLEAGNKEAADNKNLKQTQLTLEELDNAAEVLSVAAIKYFDLRLNRIQNYKFDFDNMLNQKGDTAVYLLYSYVRLCSIIKKSEISVEDISKNEGFEFTTDYELTLARHLVKFPDVVENVTTELEINRLCDFLYSLSVKVAEAYHAYKIIGNKDTLNRIQLIYCCQKIMEKCFFLLGIKTINKI